MTWLDLAVLGVMALSMAWGLWRGLVHEVISLAAWVIAFLAANWGAAPLAELVPARSPRPDWHVFVAFVAIFLVTLTITTLTIEMPRITPVSTSTIWHHHNRSTRGAGMRAYQNWK